MKNFISHIKSLSLWVRLAYMLLFLLLLSFVRVILLLVIGGQFLTLLITGADNKNLRSFGQSLASWIFQTMQFLTFNSETKPFPFADWPAAMPSDGFSIADVSPGSSENNVVQDESDIPSFTSTDIDDSDKTK